MARSACSLLVLAGTVFSTAITGVAAAAARRGAPNDANWKDAIPTATAADADVGDRWTHLRVSHRPTNAPKLVDLRRDVNAKRTHFGANTCGFFPDNDGLPLTCDRGMTCTNIGNYRGCCQAGDCMTSSFSSACLNHNDPGCADAGPGTICCDQDPNLGYCLTLVWSTSEIPNRLFTLFNCDNKIFSGAAILDAEPPSVSTTAASLSSSSTSASTSAATPTASTTASESGSVPVAPIVGGVIGGLAIVGLVVLGIFWMFFRNKRAAARGSYEPAANMEPDTPGGGYTSSVVTPAPPYKMTYSGSFGSDVASPPPGNTPGITSEVVMVKPDGLAVQVSTRPLSMEMPTSPMSKEMATSPTASELPGGGETAELPSNDWRR